MKSNYIPREKKTPITQYLNDSIEQMDCLEYFLEDEFEYSELSNILNEDLPHGPNIDHRAAFIDDICSISQTFFEESNTKKISIQVQVITSDKCRFFHVDNNIRRLLCTYKGPGTQWIEESNVNYDWIGKGDNDKIVKDKSKIQEANEFDILILRGLRYSRQSRGTVHRSPEIQQTNQKRILLKLDECQEETI